MEEADVSEFVEQMKGKKVADADSVEPLKKKQKGKGKK